MNNRKTFKQVPKILLSFMALVTVVTSWALDPLQVIESRQANYRELGGAYKGIRDELQKKRPLMIMVRQHAGQMQMLAHSQAHADWFPVGTGVETGIETAALATIWDQKGEFDLLRTDLNERVDMLVRVVAKGDLKAIAKQHRTVGGACKQCHDSYREEED